MTLACFEVVDGEGRVWTLARTSGMVGEDVDMAWVIRLLVEAGLWEEVPGGYRVHDYLDYQPSKDEVITEREKKREAGRKGGLASAQARRARAEAKGEAGGSEKTGGAHAHRTSTRRAARPRRAEARGYTHFSDSAGRPRPRV